MNERSLIYTFIVVGIALTSSEIFKAEILTWYEISSYQVYPNQRNLLSVQNTGYVQANNVVIQISSDEPIKNFSDICAEGQISRINDTTLVAEFLIMTPYIPCEFELTVTKPTSLTYTITSKDRLGPWIKGGSTLLIYLPVVILLAIVAFELLFIVRSVRDIVISNLYITGMRLSRSKTITSENYKKTIDFVKDEYGIRIDFVDAKVLETVYCGKKTINNLKKQSGLSRMHTKYRVNKMRRYELLMSTEMKVDEELNSHFQAEK